MSTPRTTTGSSTSCERGASRRLQDRRAEAEEQSKQRLAAWEAEKQRRRAAGENPDQPGDQEKNPSWWKDMKSLPGRKLMKEDEKPGI